MSLFSNFNEESKDNILWENIGIMLESKNVVNWVSIFQIIMRLRYEDSSNMADHMNVFLKD